MVSNYGVITGGVVVNAALAEAEFAREQGWVLLPEFVGPNWLYDGSTFSPPPPPPPPTHQQQEVARAAAYRAESDPIFFMAQRGEATEAEWFAKVAEIKARFPYPAE